MLKSLLPAVGLKPKVLILGTMPGIISLQTQKYYNHPSNKFWKFLFRYFNCEFTEDYAKRINLITNKGIALWDVLKSCVREGENGKSSSLDSVIKEGVPNDIENFIKEHNIRAIFLNGQKAFELFKKMFPNLVGLVHLLPSTSPANARDVQGQYNKWKEMLEKYLL